MKAATDVYRNRLALIFDFDGTLGPGTYESLLEHLGFNAEQFKEEHIVPLLKNGWEEPLAQSYSLELISRGRIPRPDGGRQLIDEKLLGKVGREMELFEGVPEMFDRVRRAAREEDRDLEVEFYLLTAGFADVVQTSTIAHEFRRIYGGAYHFDPDTGGIDAAKRLVTHPEKPRYILQICKGKELEQADPVSADEVLPREKWRLPLDQVVYVGDGMSDIPAFELVTEHGGIALGVVCAGDSAEDWTARERLHTDRVVENLAPSDYREGSELMRSLLLAVQSIARRIAIRRLSQGDDPEP